jgi:hypothetical protein
MAADPYSTYGKSSVSYGTLGKLVTPGATDFDPIPKAVTCVTAGNITIVPVGNADAAVIAYTGVPIGFIPPFRVRRVTAATATVWTVED